ncbi:MAG: hypothetical protein LBV60_22685 [Streptomyces sp.]|jgi:hypothetical protein|nr:hypothetical protein [Streptomyces sp.]
MKAFVSIVTLALVGVILADMFIHPVGVKAAGNAANGLLSSTYGAMLGGGA